MNTKGSPRFLTRLAGGVALQPDRQAMVVAIDGPAGAGKSTVARQVAAQLGCLYVDTGAMYRAVTLKLLRLGVNPEDAPQVAAVVSNTRIDLAAGREGVGCRVFLDGEDVTAFIRQPAVSEWVPVVAANPAVRQCLLRAQRILAERGGVVMDGRDIGTVVAPDAGVKVYLTASLAERARRRCQELQERGHPLEAASVIKEIEARDRADKSRAVSPLQRAADAVLIDTTHLPIGEVVQRVLDICNRV